MDALTPAHSALHLPSQHKRRPFSGQVSLVHTARPSMHSVTLHLARPTTAFQLPAQRGGLPGPIGFPMVCRSQPWSGLRLESAGSPSRTAESCSSSYGLHVRRWLLPTPPHGGAVTFGYRERASPGRGLPPLKSRLLPGARIPAFAGM